MSYRLGKNFSNQASPIHVVILGGGISGLAAAHSIISSKKPGVQVTLLEASPRFGGWVNTVTYDDGCTFELGPRTLRPVGLPGKRTLKLISELGLEDKIVPVTSKHPSASKRYVYANGKMNLLPNTLLSLFVKKPPLTRSIISSLMREPFQTKLAEADETVHSFFKRRVGEEIADYFVDAFCFGIYASGSKELSIRSCFPSLIDLEKKYGSMVVGTLLSKQEKIPLEDSALYRKSQQEKWRIWTLRNGIQELVDRWSKHLSNNGLNILLNNECKALEFTESGKVFCSTNGGSMEADHVISSLSAIDLAKLIPSQHQKLKTLLTKIKNVTVAVVNLEFQGKKLPFDGFGFLIPSCESMDVLGVVFDSCVFEDGRGNTKLTVMMGGSKYETLFGSPDNSDEEYLLHVALNCVNETLGINEKPLKSLVSIQKNCIPQYHVGHTDLVTLIRSSIEEENLPLTLIGSSYKAVGLNDCIYNSEAEVESMMNSKFNC